MRERPGRTSLTSFLPLALLLLIVLAGCRPPDAGGASARAADPDVRVRVEAPPEGVVGPETVRVLVLDGDVPASDATVTVTGDMTHAGMVPVVADAPPADAPGAYLTDDFAYDMAGDWVLTAEVTLPDGRRGFGETRVTVARP
mgnify:CR=1 FL=1